MLKILRQIARVGIATEAPPPADGAEVQRIRHELLHIVGRALAIRQVDAGSCNGCELEIHALNNPYYNLEGLGIRFVASPRHADLLLVTGPVSRDGGVFGESYASCGRIANVLPVVDVQVPGCPPPPIALLRGILQAVRGAHAATRRR